MNSKFTKGKSSLNDLSHVLMLSNKFVKKHAIDIFFSS